MPERSAVFCACSSRCRSRSSSPSRRASSSIACVPLPPRRRPELRSAVGPSHSGSGQTGTTSAGGGADDGPASEEDAGAASSSGGGSSCNSGLSIDRGVRSANRDASARELRSQLGWPPSYRRAARCPSRSSPQFRRRRRPNSPRTVAAARRPPPTVAAALRTAVFTLGNAVNGGFVGAIGPPMFALEAATGLQPAALGRAVLQNRAAKVLGTLVWTHYARRLENDQRAPPKRLWRSCPSSPARARWRLRGCRASRACREARAPARARGRGLRVRADRLRHDAADAVVRTRGGAESRTHVAILNAGFTLGAAHADGRRRLDEAGVRRVAVLRVDCNPRRAERRRAPPRAAAAHRAAQGRRRRRRRARTAPRRRAGDAEVAGRRRRGVAAAAARRRHRRRDERVLFATGASTPSRRGCPRLGAPSAASTPRRSRTSRRRTGAASRRAGCSCVLSPALAPGWPVLLADGSLMLVAAG